MSQRAVSSSGSARPTKNRLLQALLGGLFLLSLYGCGGGGGGGDAGTGISPMEIEVQTVVASFLSRLNAAAVNPSSLSVDELQTDFMCAHTSGTLTHNQFFAALQNFFKPENTASVSVSMAPITVYPLGDSNAKAYGTLSFRYFDKKTGTVKTASDSAQFELLFEETWKITRLAGTNKSDPNSPVSFPPPLLTDPFPFPPGLGYTGDPWLRGVACFRRRAIRDKGWIGHGDTENVIA